MRRAVPLLLVAVLAAPALAGEGSLAAPESCGKGKPQQVVEGTFTDDLEGSYVLVPFPVARRATKVRVRLCYDQPESPTSSNVRHTLDLGLYESRGRGDRRFNRDEFRGWGGSSRPDVFVSRRGATLGFLPGRVPGGIWAAELGVAAVAGQDEGDSGGDVAWRVEIFTSNSASHMKPRWTPAPYDATPAIEAPGWYKGDLHVHAEHSSPKDATMKETFDYAFSDEGAGLDFITLSDYVTSRQWGEIGRFQPAYPDKLIIRSAEVITYRGHINNHASARFVDYRAGSIFMLKDKKLAQIRKPKPARRIFKQIRDAGGLTQVNHPTIFDSSVPPFANICRGCSWEYSDEETNWDLVDAFEIATGPGGTSSPEGNELGPNPFTPLAIDWWDQLRNEGFRITAVGSSDSHNAGGGNNTTQSPIGEATTVVYATELSERGIQAAIEAGHTYVKMFSPDGPDLRFAATAPGLQEPAIMGDAVTAENADFTATVLGAAPDPQVRTLLVFRNGEEYRSVPVTSDEFTYKFASGGPGHYRLQLQRGSAIEAVTNPITIVAPQPGALSVRRATPGRRSDPVPGPR